MRADRKGSSTFDTLLCFCSGGTKAIAQKLKLTLYLNNQLRYAGSDGMLLARVMLFKHCYNQLA